MKVLIACEFSGTVREAFAALGHDAWSCDLLPTVIPGQHYEGSVFHMLCDSRFSMGFDLIIAHPPCTYLTNSGVRWLYNADKTRNEARWIDMYEGACFFRTLLNNSTDRVCIENPIPHKYASELIGKKYDQIIQPWQ